MADDIQIRPATWDDIPPMLELLKQLFSIESDFSFDPQRQRRGLHVMLTDENARLILVAQRGQEVVGMCTMQILISTAQGGNVGLVEDVVVRPDCQCQGIGTRLMQEMTRCAQKKGLTRLQLLADRNNENALRFYQSRGWSSTQLICLRLSEEKLMSL